MCRACTTRHCGLIVQIWCQALKELGKLLSVSFQNTKQRAPSRQHILQYLTISNHIIMFGMTTSFPRCKVCKHLPFTPTPPPHFQEDSGRITAMENSARREGSGAGILTRLNFQAILCLTGETERSSPSPIQADCSDAKGVVTFPQPSALGRVDEKV